jgi:TonB-dependent receptor
LVVWRRPLKPPLPDQNVAEAVKRLPGITTWNDQGEGRYVVIRGIDPSLASVTLNGLTLPAPEPDGRVVKLDDLPSAMIQSIAVSKSLLASQDANAIAGEVAIKTKTAFDAKKPLFFDARASAGYYTLNKKSPYELDATLGGRFGSAQQFGAVISANYSRRPIESQNYQGATSATYATYGVPDTNGLRDYNLTRTRLGLVGNFDWHPSDSAKIYIRSSYSKFEDHETRDQNRLADNTAAGSAPTTATATILVRRREENDNTKSVALGGDFAQVAGGTLSVLAGWTRAEKKDPLRSEFTFTTSKNYVTALNYDAATYPYTLAPAGSFAGVFADASKFYFSKANFESRSAYEQIWQGKADYTHPLAFGDAGSEWAVGVKLLDRHKADDHNKVTYSATKASLATGWLASNVAYTGNTSFYDGQFALANRINYYAARDYLNANLATYATSSATTTTSDSLAADYDVRETISAAYAMAKLRAGSWTVIPGVRIEHTHDSVKGNTITTSSKPTDTFNTFASQTYTDVLPGVNLKYEPTSNLVVRGAFTTSIGRPNYPQLAPYVYASDTTAVSMGNPNLKPYHAVNLDASLEYYPAKGSILAVSAFHKHVGTPIYTLGSVYSAVTLAGVNYTSVTVTQPINIDRSLYNGVEFNLQHQFLSLPGALSGFGLSANYTHVWGHGVATGYRAGLVPLLDQPHDIATAQVFYEKYGLGARVAFSYRSAMMDTFGTSALLDQYTDASGQLDVHVSYQIRKSITVFGDAVNLTDAAWHHYLGAGKNYLVERERYGTQLRGGVQVHF